MDPRWPRFRPRPHTADQWGSGNRRDFLNSLPVAVNLRIYRSIHHRLYLSVDAFPGLPSREYPSYTYIAMSIWLWGLGLGAGAFFVRVTNMVIIKS